MAESQGKLAPARHIPILEGVLPVSRARAPADILAGITLACLAIPEVMGYTKIAGMPVITGLYTLLVPMALFSIFGSSRRLVVGADSATAAIMAAGLAGLATTASPEYVALAGVLALITAVFLILARVARIGFLADFLSRTVLIGFLTGVGLQVAISQIAGMLGIPGGSGRPLQQLVTDVQQLPQTNPATLVLSAVVVGVIVGARRINTKIPGALIAVIGAIVLSYAVNLAAYGIAVLGPVPGGLPSLHFPAVGMTPPLLQTLLPTAFSMFLVILAQSAATSRAYATRYSETFSENVDLVGLGLANIGAGLTGAFVVNGSPTKTQMVDSAGGRSQMAQLTTVVIVILVLLFLTGPLSYLPNAALASVVFLIGLELIDYRGMRKVRAQRPVEFWVALITALVVIAVGVEQGIILAIVLSLLVHTRHGYRARNNVLVTENNRLEPVPVGEAGQALPGLVFYRFSHGMYYANTEQFSQEILALAGLGPPPVAWLCLDLVAVDDVDFSAAATLRETHAELARRHVRVVFSHVSDYVRHQLDVSGLTDLVGSDGYYARNGDVVAAYRRAAHASSASARS